jgi:UDP:flavonoid glycosyltransferase YjiC (YdhE family)
VAGCVSSAEFIAALARGTLPYTRRVIERYIEEDLRILDRVEPDVVVGDFRLSLGISAATRGVPHVALINAVWSPHVQRAIPLPEHPMTRVLGLRLASALFPVFQPIAFASLARPFDRARRARGLPALGGLLETYCSGDFTAYPDLPDLFEFRQLPSTHRFIGAATFGPAVSLPAWWDKVPSSRPWVFVAMGSSGKASALPGILDALSTLDVEVLVATSERGAVVPTRPNLWVTQWLPLDPVLTRTSVVVGNGGAGAVYFALAHGVPMLCIPSNMDQHMIAEAVVRAGAARMLRSDRASAIRIRADVVELLRRPTFRERARSLASSMRRSDVGATLQRLVHEAAASRAPRATAM